MIVWLESLNKGSWLIYTENSLLAKLWHVLSTKLCVDPGLFSPPASGSVCGDLSMVLKLKGLAKKKLVRNK